MGGKLKASAPRGIKYYYTVRNAHLERQIDAPDAWLLYTKTRADFSDDLARRTPWLKRVTALGLLCSILSIKPDVLELPEPLAIRIWPQLIMTHLTNRAFRALRLAQTQIVSYAIENYDPERKLAEFSHLPIRITRPIVWLVLNILIATSDRIAFGTSDALRVYESAAGRTRDRWCCLTKLIWALPGRPKGTTGEKHPLTVCFVGSLEQRKGIKQLVDAWPLVEERIPGATLTIVSSTDVSGINDFASEYNVTVRMSPTRSEIFDRMASSKCLVLLSQSSKGWKEQVGLPIVEGLERGCEIVTTDETGIAPWLRAHGHQVVTLGASSNENAAAIMRALRSSRSSRQVVESLPEIDGRTDAHDWLYKAGDDLLLPGAPG